MFHCRVVVCVAGVCFVVQMCCFRVLTDCVCFLSLRALCVSFGGGVCVGGVLMTRYLKPILRII